MPKLTPKKGAEWDGKGPPSGLQNGSFFEIFPGGHLEETRSDFSLFLKPSPKRDLIDFWLIFKVVLDIGCDNCQLLERVIFATPSMQNQRFQGPWGSFF